ncbi:MAG: TonB-dependent receptor [Candidatus Pseudobacter hemicellulosilyticus]|uniref:TonB-dependent receptor n=1 Tax=Candidatus Pseudobacter hemicellulosilyticus TaxID=3121375 RepID=A0AAJ5WPJ9_9BACT|nr:MAG: TonB-dependent receptor [Pseudobacter sp.]
MKKSNETLAALATALLFLLLSFQGLAQQSARTITGKVTSPDGKPVEDATVTVKGSSQSVVTNATGSFTISLPAGKDTLTITHVGYLLQDIAVGARTQLSIQLSSNNAALEEVVVIAYGTARKVDLTGSVISVKSDELKAVPTASFDQALQGRAAGVQVTQNSGKPGAEPSIRIRGISSITANNEPLYVIDGMLVNSDGGDFSGGVTRGPRIGPLASISPGDIESIEILKDASATAMYGSRGANGVVLITTKRGKSGKGRVDLEAYHGYQEVANKLNLLDAEGFANLVNDAKLNAGQTPIYVNPKNLGKGTDWQDELFRVAPLSSYQATVSGADDKTKYALSGSFFTQDGIILNSDFKRYSFRANLDRTITDKLTVGTNLAYSRLSSQGVLTNDGNIVPGVVSSAMLFNPVLPVKDASVKGGYTFENDRGKILGNPIAEANEYVSNTILSRILGSVYARYAFSKQLEFKSSFGIDAFNNQENSFGPNFLKRTQASKGEASLAESQGMTWLNENTLSYNNTFNGKHRINAVAGFTVQQFNSDRLLVYAFDFPDNRTGYHNIASALNPQKPANSESSWSMLSYLGRVNYTLSDKYLFTLTGRVDGSSKFGANNKYAFFPSAAFAWRVSQEDFMQDIEAISDLKFRASYGVIGNQAILPYQSLALIGPYGEGVFNSPSGSEVYTGQEPLTYVNSDLRWETTRQLDIGFDLALFNNRVQFTADYYNKKTFDLLLTTPIPSTSGFGTTVLNVGNIRNHGFDFDLRTQNLRGGELTWNSAINFSINRNEITNLNSETDIPLSYGILLRRGIPISSFYGYIFDGIFQTDAEAASSPVLIGQEPTGANPASHAKAGDRRYRDINNDGKIDADDRVILGNAQPKFTWGFNNDFSYRQFTLSFFWQGSQGNKMANLNNLDLLNFTGQNNVLADAALNRWTPANPGNKYPRALAAGGLDAGVYSSAIVEDASYVRLKNVTLSYNLPAKVLNRLKARNLRIYASATNLFTITDYSGYDPEANTAGQSTTLNGVDLGGYPQSKVYLLGVNIGL